MCFPPKRPNLEVPTTEQVSRGGLDADEGLGEPAGGDCRPIPVSRPSMSSYPISPVPSTTPHLQPPSYSTLRY